MKKAVVLYLHMHQPNRIKQYSVFDIGNNHQYFDTSDGSDLNNEKVFKKVAEKSYRPMLSLIQKLLGQYPDFCLSLSITGSFLEQAELWAPDVIQSLQKLVASGRVEIVAETYYHSLAFFYSRAEFEDQVQQHRKKIYDVFGVTPTAFRNTELAYNDELALWAEQQGYEAIIAEGWDPILSGRRPNVAYQPTGTDSIGLLLKNYQLSDDIAFRFGDRTWSQWPLRAEMFVQWLDEASADGPLVNLFMDFETFGEHQWVDTHIFEFFERFTHDWRADERTFSTLTNAVRLSAAERPRLSMPQTVTWADSERDLSAWTGNSLQREALKYLYDLEHDVIRSNDTKLIHDWRLLQTSDLFYYMATKWERDGDVHSYFSPYSSPYDAFLYYMNVIRDVRLRLMHMHKLGGLNG